MKLGNFASFDPTLRARGIKGLGHGSRQDREVWDEFCDNSESFAIEAWQAAATVGDGGRETEVTKVTKVRLVQSFFRDSVLASYDSSCSFCRLAVPALLNASHIIPWNVNKARRADPRNGLALCTLHDRAFDRGLMTVMDGGIIAIAPSLKQAGDCKVHREAFVHLDGADMTLPHRFAPDPEALAYHRENVFQHGFSD